MKKKLFITFLLLSIFIFHFINTSLYILPFNPVKAQYNSFVNSYMQPLFTQNWQLFAPNPLSDSIYVYYQVRKQDGTVSEWYDISTPLYDSNQKNRISPNNRLVRIGSTAYLQTVHEDVIVSQLKEKKEDVSSEIISDEDKRLEVYRDKGVDILYRFVFSYVPKQFKQEEVKDVRVRVRVTESIPFSEKDNPDAVKKNTYQDYEWRKFENVNF